MSGRKVMVQVSEQVIQLYSGIVEETGCGSVGCTWLC